MSDEQTNFDYLWSRLHALLYQVRLSALYHQKRERFFELLDKIVKAVAIIGGSVTLAKVADPQVVTYFAAAITIVSTLSLVFGFSDRSKKHADFAKSFRQLEAEMLSFGERDLDEARLAAWAVKLRTLESTEPPALGALVVACQNELAIAAEQKDKVVQLPTFRRLTKDFLDWRMA